MGIKKILTDELPGISFSIKNMINQGIWCLYEINNSTYSYVLKSTDTTYFLDKKGNILMMESSKNIELNSLIYFSDLPVPPTVNSFLSA